MPKSLIVTVVIALTSISTIGADWPMQSGSPQRTGWAKSEHLLTKTNIASLDLLYKYRADNLARGLDSLTSPIISGDLITYRGFKEMLIFSGSSDKMFSLDADLDKLLWQTNFPDRVNDKPERTSTSACPGGLTAPVLMAGSSSGSIHFAARASRTPATPGVNVRPRSPYFPPLSQSVFPLRPTTLTELAALYTVSSDGELHIVNSSTGEDLIRPVKFLPANAKVGSMNILDNVVYVTTTNNCDGYLNALYAVDLLSPDRKVTSFSTKFGGFSGTGGTAIGGDGTVYVQVAYGTGDALSQYHDSVLALTPRDLKVKDYFAPRGKSLDKKSLASPGITPMVFSRKGREFIAAAGRDGRVYLLDAKSLGGADHKTPLFQTEPIASPSKNYDGNGFRGTFSSWYDIDTQNRWVYAPLCGPPKRNAKIPTIDRTPSTSSIVAFKIGGQSEQPALDPLWISRDIPSPAPAVIANGMVFALSTGESPRVAKKNGQPYSVSEWQAMAGHAVLYALDAINGRQLYSSGDKIAAYSHADGLAVANGRVYFAAGDNTVYCFRFPKQQPQLMEQ